MGCSHSEARSGKATAAAAKVKQDERAQLAAEGRVANEQVARSAAQIVLRIKRQRIGTAEASSAAVLDAVSAAVAASALACCAWSKVLKLEGDYIKRNS